MCTQQPIVVVIVKKITMNPKLSHIYTKLALVWRPPAWTSQELQPDVEAPKAEDSVGFPTFHGVVYYY